MGLRGRHERRASAAVDTGERHLTLAGTLPASRRCVDRTLRRLEARTYFRIYRRLKKGGGCPGSELPGDSARKKQAEPSGGNCPVPNRSHEIIYSTVAVLRTPDDVVRAGGPLGAEYFDVVPYTDGTAGFSVKRLYPPETPLGRVVMRGGEPAVAGLLRIVVDPPTAEGGVSRVGMSASFYPLWSGGWIGPDPASHPHLTPDAVQRLRGARRPIALDFKDDFVWDSGEHLFQNEAGETVTGRQMFDYVYAYHCRTLSRRFVLRYGVQRAVRWLVQRAVWRGQDWCLWLLEHGYEIRPTTKGGRQERSLFHQYTLDEFERQTDKDGTHFFGFQTSRRSFFSNVVALTIACVTIYYAVPRFGLLRAIYGNGALTTVALAFGFLVSDQAAPLILKGLVCLLSRFRRKVLNFLERVKA